MRYATAQKIKSASETVFWKDVEEGWIRYDLRSGSTQLVAPLARFVIDLIDESPAGLSLSDIVDEVLRAEPEAEPDNCQIEVANVLRILSEAQLIHSVQP